MDECVENSTLCGSLHCVNLPGSFQCLGKCDVGFKRTMDDKECVGKILEIFFINLSSGPFVLVLNLEDS